MIPFARLNRLSCSLLRRSLSPFFSARLVSSVRLVSPALLAACASVIFGAEPAYAHQKWFYSAEQYPTRWVALAERPVVFCVFAAVLLTAAAGWIWSFRARRDFIPGPEALGATPAGRKKFYSLVPLILGIHVGVPLLVLGIQGELFSPNNRLEDAASYWIGVWEIGVGLSFLYGGLTRIGAALLAALWMCGIRIVGLESMLENVHYLGFAAFFLLAGRGPYSIDRLLFPALEPAAELSRWAMKVLRVTVGFGLSVVALTEKLANPDLAESFLKVYPLNFTAWLGMPISDRIFAYAAGTGELLIGLCLMFGFFPRLIIATIWVMINMTLTVFNWVELVGHLPLYGVMGVLLIWTPEKEDERLWIEGLSAAPPLVPGSEG